MAEGDYEFRPKPNVLGKAELDEVLRVAPPPEAFGKGFTLQEPDVDRVIAAARQLEGAQVAVDPNLPPPQAVEQLLRVIRILQTALDVQFSENEEVTADFNELQNNEVRRLREENNRLRELRDREEVTGDAGELRRRNEDLLDQLDEMEDDLKRMREQEKEATARAEELETGLKDQRAEVERLQTRLSELTNRYDRTRDDHKDLQQRYRTLSQEHDRLKSETQLSDQKQHSEWKIERLTKDNRALELANTELRKELAEVKGENLEVSEKIVELNTTHQELLSKNVVLEARIEEMANDKDNLLSIQDELRGELQDKMNLLDEFEDKFNRQYRSWEDEKAGLVAQIEALRRDVKRGRGRGDDDTGPGGGASRQELEALRAELNDAREKEILLLEAYEQLENDVSKEVDRALARQAEEMARMQRRVDFLQGKLEQQDEDAEDKRDQAEELETELKDAIERNKKYEQGVYGLPQAVEEIRELKQLLTKEEKRTRDLIVHLNKQAAKVEDLHDENAVLRKKLGLSDDAKVDISDIKMQKEATIAQLRALNALLERQVADLEEERRKLRMEMKFRAKYHGQHALEMGLSNEKLLLLEQYADDLKNNRVEEARIVEQMQRRIEFLEVRLAEVMAYADIPPSMRPALSEFDPTGLGTLQSAMQQALMEGYGGGGGGLGGVGGGVMSGIKAKEIEAVRKTVQEAMRRLRNMSQSLLEQRNVSDHDYMKYVDGIAAELANADKVLEALLKDPTGLMVPGQPGQPGAGGQPGAPMSPGAMKQSMALGAMQLMPGDASYLADAVAEELRDRLRELARQVAGLQAEVAEKDVRIKFLLEAKDELEKKIGMAIGDRKSEYVTIAEYEDLQLEVTGLKEQLIAALEELASREREASELHETSLRYHTKMQTFSDQVKLLYREYSGAVTAWKVEKNILEKKGRKAQADADAYKIATRELQTALDVLTANRDMTEVEKEYLDTVRRMAVVQIKQAKLARELEASVAGEKALTGRVTELEEEVRDVSTTARSRIRWLEAQAEQQRRRMEQMFRELEGSASLTTYQSLAAKHSRLQHEYRKLVEEQAESVTAASQEDVFRLRDELAELLVQYDKVANQLAEHKAKLHNAELVIKNLGGNEGGSQADDAAGFWGGGGNGVANKALSISSSQKAAQSQTPSVQVDNVLAQELVSARVQEDASKRRVELVEKERDRVQRSLQDLQDYGKELEQRLAQSAAELELARQTAGGLEKRLNGSKLREEVDEMARRMHQAEALAQDVQRNHSELQYKAEDAERRAEAANRDRLRYLAEITNLKAALRDMSGKSEKQALIGRLHLELDHSRAKESLARNALNRSELHRIELEKVVRKQKMELANLLGRLTAHQDQAAWADRQRHEATAQLDVALAGRTDAWKAKLWARKLELLKKRNESLGDGLEVARTRILRTEDAKQEAELKLELAEEVASIPNRGMHELGREVARLSEQLMQMRLEKGRVQREDMLLREKVHYTERVNAELHDLLEKYEAEYFQAQSQLEADRAAAESRAVRLQEEVTKLQEKINALLAARELGDVDGKQLRRSDDGAAKKPGRHAEQDRDQLIALIEALKVAREEAEHLRTDRSRLQVDYDGVMSELEDTRRHHKDALDRLAQQSDALLYALNQFKTKGADDTVFEQMKAVAEATINELKNRLKDRDRVIGALRRQLEEEAEAALARHNADRAEIERLNEKLFMLNDGFIQDLKGVLDRLPLKAAGAQVPEDVIRLRDAVERLQDMITVLKNRLEQKDAAIDLLKLTYEQQIKQLQEELAKARLEADSKGVARGDDAALKQQIHKLSMQVKMKDEMLRQLKAAIKALEAKLTQVMKEHADEKMQAASWRLQEQLQEQLNKLTEERDELARRLALTEDNLAAAGGLDKHVEEQMESLRRRIQEEMDKRAKVEKRLMLVQEELQKFKNARDTVVDLTTGMSIEAKKQIEELQRRIHVLERLNAQLKKKRAVDDAADGAEGGGGGDDGDGGGGGGGGRRSAGRPPARRPAAPPRRDNDGPEDQGGVQEPDPEAEERRERALLQWEEGKKLNARIEGLKKQVASKTSEVVSLQKELERRGAQAATLQAEADKQAAAIRDLSDKLRRAMDAPRNDKAKLDQALERCAAAEDARDSLTAELTRLRTQLQAQPGGSSAVPPSPGGAALRREEDVIELRLQRDQLQLQVKRLKDRVAELTGGEAGSGRRAGSAGARPGTAGSLTSGREAELLSTIANLKAAVEKASANTTPTTKYMAELSRRKEAVKDAETARAETERLRQQAAVSSRMVTELQAANAELRRQLKIAQGSAAQAAAAAGAGRGPGVAELAVRLSNMEVLLGQREEEVAALRGAVAQRDAELDAVRGPGGGGAGPSGSGPGGPEVAALRRQLRELEAENEDLRNELNAFDPSFWDEVMEMKQQHAELSRTVGRYEELIVELSERLGIAPPLQQRGAGGAAAGGARRGGGAGGEGGGAPRRAGR